MRLRPHVVSALVRKDASRLVRNGPALMLLGLFVLVGVLLGSSGLVDEEPGEAGTPATQARREASWIVHWENGPWIELLKRRSPPELGLRFVDATESEGLRYPPDVCVIEIRGSRFFADRGQVRRPVHYRYPGNDPKVLWPVTRWFLSVSLEHFGQMPQFFETIQPLAPPARTQDPRAALERVSIADVLNVSLLGSALLTTILFFASCGLLVSLTAQERERGALRALLLTPATFLEFVLSKIVVHVGMALTASAVVMGALQPAVLGSLLFWSTMLALSLGYFSIGLLIASFAKDQAAPNLLSFGYLMLIGALNLLSYRFEAFRLVSGLTFERYGLRFTLLSLENPGLDVASSLAVMRSTEFRSLVLIVGALVLISSAIGARRLRAH
ncbi:MAG: hypothetical protein AAFU73_04595 [Planctomycetota bacterium]